VDVATIREFGDWLRRPVRFEPAVDQPDEELFGEGVTFTMTFP
jgi:hypothetical protein